MSVWQPCSQSQCSKSKHTFFSLLKFKKILSPSNSAAKMSKMSNVHHGSKNNAMEMRRACLKMEMELYRDRKVWFFFLWITFWLENIAKIYRKKGKEVSDIFIPFYHYIWLTTLEQRGQIQRHLKWVTCNFRYVAAMITLQLRKDQTAIISSSTFFSKFVRVLNVFYHQIYREVS